MAKTNAYPYTDKLLLYDKIIASIKECERKGAAMPYTSVNGNMFSFLDKEGKMGLRLPEKERTLFTVKHKTKLCEAHGTVLKEYVLVPDLLFADTTKMKAYFQLSYKYASSLKVKTKKTK